MKKMHRMLYLQNNMVYVASTLGFSNKIFPRAKVWEFRANVSYTHLLCSHYYVIPI
jgi:hypothetical protein